MAEALLIALREGFEASLIVAIVLAFVRKAGAPTRAVWVGTISALVVAAVAGLVLHATIDGLTGVARQRTFAAICVAAAALLTWMLFWMARHSRSMKGDLEARAGSALASGSSLGIALVAFTAVAREGLETALFLVSATSASDGRSIALGIVLGLLGAVALGALVYQGSRRIDLRRFFMVTGGLIILFAAGLLDRAVQFLQSSGDLGTANGALYDLTAFRWLTIDSQSGRVLAGIFGWDPRPSVEQVVVYLAFLVPVVILYFWERPARGAAKDRVTA